MTLFLGNTRNLEALMDASVKLQVSIYNPMQGAVFGHPAI